MPAINTATIHAALNDEDVVVTSTKRRRPGRRERSEDIEDIAFRSDKAKPSRKPSTVNKETTMTAPDTKQSQAVETVTVKQPKVDEKIESLIQEQPVTQEVDTQNNPQPVKEETPAVPAIAVRDLKDGAIARMGTDSWRNIIEHAQKALLKDNRKSIIPFMKTRMIIDQENDDIVRRSLIRGLLRHLSNSIGLFCELDHEDGMTLRLLSLKSNDWAIFKVQIVGIEIKLSAEIKTDKNEVACLSTYEATHLSLTNLTTQEFLTVLDDCLNAHLKTITQLIAEPIAKALTEGFKKAGEK